jgi:hypothetical protein
MFVKNPPFPPAFGLTDLLSRTRGEDLKSLLEKVPTPHPREGHLSQPPRAPLANSQENLPVPTAFAPLDRFEPTAATLPVAEEPGQKQQAIEADGLKISFQFNLFYELSQKVSARMGQQGLNRFMEVSSTVSETFAAGFSLSIDPIGSFMKSTDKSLDISPETTARFLDAVEGLADLSPKALENFLKETESFFDTLEQTYGPAGGAFDTIKSQMQEQAKAFFADVTATRETALGGPPAPAPTALPAGDPPAEPAGTELPIPLTGRPGTSVGQDEYQAFLKEFLSYVGRFREQMMRDFLAFASPPARQGGLTNQSDPGKMGTSTI